MKLKKYTFRTPLFGSIYCESLLLDTDGHIELSPEQMCTLYNNHEELMMFLTGNMEDLAKYVPEELVNIVYKAEFGDFGLIEGNMFLRTHIWTAEELTGEQLSQIQEWITGQMSDGWGEGLEQLEWMHRRVERPCVYFDEDAVCFEEDYELCEVYYCVHPYNFSDYYIELEECEDIDVTTEFTVVATIALTDHNREVVKIAGQFMLDVFLKEFGMNNLAQEIKDCAYGQFSTFYIVKDNFAPIKDMFPYKWICQNKDACVLYDRTENEYASGTHTPLKKAIPELLK